MRLHRFHTTEALGGKDLILQDEALVHQWLRVFRYDTGNQVILFNGDGKDYVYEITAHDRADVSLALLEVRDGVIEPARKVCVAFSLVKKDNIELMLQKCTELGVSRFTPLLTERSEKKGFNIERARTIVTEACEQSGRGTIPEITELSSLDRFLDTASGTVIAFHSAGKAFGNAIVSSGSEIVILIGPEGGWSPNELELLVQHEIPLYSMGELTLRAETAAIVASALLLIR